MTYVLTGASGHIGNNLARYIREKEPGADIAVLTRRPIGRELAGVDCRQAVGDLGDDTFLAAHIHRDSVVIHMAGLIDLTDKRKEESYRINYLLTKQLCDLCREIGARKFIYTGSVDGIARPTDGAPIAEPKDFDPTKVEGNYGKTKAMAMAYVQAAIERDSAFPCAMVLPSAVIGAHDYKPSAVGGVVRGVLSGKPEFGIPGGYNFVNVRDVCAAIYTLCQNDRRGTYILAGEDASVRELYEAINRKKGYRRRPIILPLWLVRPYVPFTRVLNKITLKALCEPHNYSYAKAAEELGYSPTPFDATLDEVIAFFESE